MKVDELIKQLSAFNINSDVKIAGIFNSDEIPKGEDWSEDENIREAESDDFVICSDGKKDKEKVVIQFFMKS